MKFGAFLAPHHPIGEHPTLQLRSDLDLVEHLDRLGLDEFWCGEHHSTGWEVIASPELFLAAAAEQREQPHCNIDHGEAKGYRAWRRGASCDGFDLRRRPWHGRAAAARNRRKTP